MLLGNIDSINIHSLLEPALLGQDVNIVPTHLPLAHAAVFCERPILEAVTTLPLHIIMTVLVLVPELHGDLVVRESEQFLAQAVLRAHQHRLTNVLQDNFTNTTFPSPTLL
jgi:hypothetical protein